jgi:hypothetical protein
MSERERPDLDQVRDAMREHDERAEELAANESGRDEPEEPERDEPEEPGGDEPEEPGGDEPAESADDG